MQIAPAKCPHLTDITRIRGIVTVIRAELDGYLRDGLRHVRRQPDAPNLAVRERSDPDLPWLLALYAHRFGVIYWIPRHETIALAGTVADLSDKIDAAAEYLDASGSGNALYNYAVTHFVRSPRRKSTPAVGRVPRNAFQPIADNALIYRDEDFTELSPDQLALPAEPRYDLHDFAHLTAARLCEELYRNYFGGDLAVMPDHLVDLVAGFDSPLPQPPHTDGVIFSKILTPLFGKAPWPELPEPAVVDWLADALVPYLLAEEAPPGAVGQTRRPVHPVELAILAQLKAYEWPASEVERHVFVRGGRDGHDDLDHLSASARLRAMTTLADRTYNEARNVLKHRAHHQAYRIVASRLLRENAWDRPVQQLLAKTLTHLEFHDYHDRARWNLFREASFLLDWAPDPNGYRR